MDNTLAYILLLKCRYYQIDRNSPEAIKLKKKINRLIEKCELS